jgi:hypothetical protein
MKQKNTAVPAGGCDHSSYASCPSTREPLAWRDTWRMLQLIVTLRLRKDWLLEFFFVK